MSCTSRCAKPLAQRSVIDISTVHQTAKNDMVGYNSMLIGEIPYQRHVNRYYSI